MSIRFRSQRGLTLRPFNLAWNIEEQIGLAIFGAALIFVSVQPVFAHDVKLGSIEIVHPWSRATPQGAAVGGGYLVLRNDGDTPDRLVAASADVAGHVEIHEMAVKDGVMTMRALPDGLAIPPHGEVSLDPGGYHLMLIGLKERLRQGQTFKGALTFEKAGQVAVDFVVESIAATGKHDMKSMPGMDMGD